MAHHGAVGTITQGKAQGTEQDRLTGTGLTAEHAHALLEVEFQRLNQGKVTDM